MSINEITMKYERKVTHVERFFAHSPFSIVTLVLRIQGRVSESMLKEAVFKVQQKHPILRARIREDKDHSPWFTSEGVGEIPIEYFPRKSADDWITCVQIASQIPFDFEVQPAIRFILVQSKDLSELVILCHHMICDGLSLAYLARDLMHHMGNPDQEVYILPASEPISLNNLPEDVTQNGLVKYFINRMNKKWETQRVSFDQEDYKAITKAYWKKFPHKLLSVELSEIQTSEIVERARKEKVTVNSALSVAFSGAQSYVQGELTYNDSILMAANLRDRIPIPCGEGMGFYAGGVQLKFRYNHKQKFWDNVRNFHQKAIPLFSNKILFKEALTWSYLDPAICESLNFKKIGSLVPELEPRYRKLFAFSTRDDVVLSILKREKMESFDNIILGTAITNLTRMDFPGKYGELELDRLFFKPGGAFPLSNINLLLGAVTCSGKLSLILEYSDKNIATNTMERIKDKAISFLLST